MARILTKDQEEMAEEINYINDTIYSGRDFEGAYLEYLDGMNKTKAKLIADFMAINKDHAIWLKLKDSKNEFILLDGIYIQHNGVLNVVIFELKKNKISKELKLVEKKYDVFLSFNKFQKLSEEDIQTFKTLNIQGKLATIEDEEFFEKLNAA